MRLYSAALAAEVHIDLARSLRPREAGHWANYPLGVIAGFAARGTAVPGFDAAIETDVPVGGGLSSSAALETAVATLLEGLTGTQLDPLDKVALCRVAEHEFAGVPCGPMDQAISALGREVTRLLFDCGSGRVDWIEFADPGVTVLVIDTRVRHSLADGSTHGGARSATPRRRRSAWRGSGQADA